MKVPIQILKSPTSPMLLMIIGSLLMTSACSERRVNPPNLPGPTRTQNPAQTPAPNNPYQATRKADPTQQAHDEYWKKQAQKYRDQQCKQIFKEQLAEDDTKNLEECKNGTQPIEQIRYARNKALKEVEKKARLEEMAKTLTPQEIEEKVGLNHVDPMAGADIDPIKMDLPLKTKMRKTSQAQDELSSLSNETTIGAQGLLDLSLRIEVKRYLDARTSEDPIRGASTEETVKRLKTIMKGLGTNPTTFKEKAEERLVNLLKQEEIEVKEIMLTSQSKTLLDVLLKGLLSEVSGTLFYIHALAANLGKDSSFLDQQLVVIYVKEGLKKGKTRLMPGVIETIEGSHHLYGIDMTREGKARVYFGPLQTLNASQVSFIHAHQFLIIQAMGATQVENLSETLTDGIKKSAQDYQANQIPNQIPGSEEISERWKKVLTQYTSARTQISDSLISRPSGDKEGFGGIRFIEP